MSTTGSDETTKLQYMELGPAAKGTIEPRADQQDRLDEFTRRIACGEFYVSTNFQVPFGCIDGRPGADIKPNSAGGSETLMVADDLTSKRFGTADGSTLSAYQNLISYLDEQQLPVGGHDDEHTDDVKTGCGANDKLSFMYAMMVKQSDAIRELAVTIGLFIDEVTHNDIIAKAKARESFSVGAKLLHCLNVSGSDRVDHLRGKHNEVIAVINFRVGMTLDRDQIDKEFEGQYQAFNVDAWSFEEAARSISLGDSVDIKQKIIAMAYYNIAAALVLGGPKLRIVLLK